MTLASCACTELAAAACKNDALAASSRAISESMPPASFLPAGEPAAVALRFLATGAARLLILRACNCAAGRLGFRKRVGFD